MSLESGTRLGPYEIVMPLGKGGMGEVYKAVDTRLGRYVAIKVITESFSADPLYRKRLRVEARTISRLQHPNVCTLYDIGSEGPIQYLVMEYLEGQTLGERLHSGPMALEEVLRIGGDIASAIDAAHGLGIVHRDLKPGNVMLGKAGAKVLDFGLAKVTEAWHQASHTRSLSTLTEPISAEGSISGTLPYMAPEQLEGKQPDLRTDIWALGCILYEMATGQRPFRAKNPAVLINLIMGSEPEPMIETRNSVPERLSWIVDQCLEKDCKQRWQSAGDLLIELRGIAENVKEGSKPVGMIFRSGPETFRKGWFAAVAVLLLIGSVLTTYWIRRPDQIAPVVAEGAAVAVLPFGNHTGNDQLDYIGLGLAAGLISQLSELPGIHVVGRSRAWNANEETHNSVALSEVLGVDVVVEGGVRSSSDGLQIEIATIDGATATVLWSESFSGKLDRLFDLSKKSPFR